MHLTILINSVVCLIGTVVGVLFAGGSIISIANMTVPWREWLLVAALLVPFTFIVSGIGAWQAYSWGATLLALGFVALPWLYTLLFVLLMTVSFR